MKLLKTYFKEILFSLLLISGFFMTRFLDISSLPIFTDEAIYVRWAQIANEDSSWRFISLTDGKQPSFIWLTMIAMRFIADPLLAGRVVSVFSGFATMVGVFFLSFEVFRNFSDKKKILVGLISSFLVLILPITIIYDRLALYDSLVAAFFVWSLYFQIRLVRNPRFDYALVLGFVLGAATLTKSSGFLSIYLVPFMFLLFDFNKKDLKKRILKTCLYFGVSTIVAYLIYSVLRLSPYFHMINQKNSIFVYSFGDWFDFSMKQRLELFISNAKGLFDWFLIYFSIPFAILVIGSFFIEIKHIKEKVLLFIFFFLPILSLCFFGKTLYPRYILFMIMPLVPLVALSIVDFSNIFKQKWVKPIFYLFILLIPLKVDYFIFKDFARAPIPKLDLEQLINGWPAGGGIKESISFFEKESARGEIMVGTQGTFGLMPAAYEIYLKENKNIRINGFWPVESDKVPDLLLDYAERIPTYFVFYQPCPDCDFPGMAPKRLNLTEVSSYQKGIGDSKLTIYRVAPIKK